MKTRILLLLLLIFCIHSHAQLSIEIGNDTIFCPGNIEVGIEIASQLIVEGGVPPYKYTWSAEVKPIEGWDRTFGASFFLDDTTSMNPTFITPLTNGWHKFTLRVTDTEENSIEDSINVRFPEFRSLTDPLPICLTLGDSILFDVLNDDVGGIHPYQSISWYPKEGLSDPESFITWCKPEKETIYYFVITDSAGCESLRAGYRRIVVNQTNIPTMSEGNRLYQYGESIYFDNPERNEVLLYFYDIGGRLCHEAITTSEQYKPDLTQGIYLCIMKKEKIANTLKYIMP